MQQSDPAGAPPLGRLLYVSALSPGTRATEVSRIVGAARQRNADDGITGILIFDGDMFCQYVEGPADAVGSLRERLDRDPRHTRMEVLLDGALPGGRRFSDWRLGYVQTAGGDDLASMRGSGGDDAMAAFERLLPLLDVEG